MLRSYRSRSIIRVQEIPQDHKIDLRYRVAALCEVCLLVSGAQSAHCFRAGAVIFCGNGASIVQADILLSALMVFVPAIAAAVVMIVVIKKEHAVVLIREWHARLRTAALHSAESACLSNMIKLSTRISLVVISQSFLGLAALIPKETRLHRSRFIAVDSISPRSSQLRCAQCVDKKLVIQVCLRYSLIFLDQLI